MYATAADPNEKHFSWDTDGILFLLDNSATTIISNERRLFRGHLTPIIVTLETADGVSTKTQLVVIWHLVLTSNTNINHTYDVPVCLFDPDTPINILGVPALGTFFGDNANASSPYEKDGTTIKLGATRSHFIWDHGRYKRHFMHGYSLMPELHLYVGNGWFNAFCTHIHYAFSSAYLIDPSAAITEPHVIPAELGDIKGDNNLYQWYWPTAVDTSEPSSKVTWNESTKPPAIDQSKKSIDFQLGMNLLYCCGNKECNKVVYEGASVDGLLHTIRLEENTKLGVYNRNLQLLDQPDFLNIPNTPLDYKNEVGAGIALGEAQTLARPRTLSPLQ